MSVSDLSASTQDYLKAIWELEEWSDQPATTSMIAKALGVKQSTVSDTVRKLADQELVSHKRYGSVQLTEQGRAHALQMVRRHRLIETFLVQVLDYSWDEVHDEAEQLEHAVSDLLVERVAELLHHPTRDPHGDPIPRVETCHEAVGHRVLEDLGLVVHLIPPVAEFADEERLDQAVAPHHQHSGRSTLVGEGDRAVPLVGDETLIGELADGLRRGAGRDADAVGQQLGADLLVRPLLGGPDHFQVVLGNRRQVAGGVVRTHKHKV